MRIEIPDFCVVTLIGPSGSGKSVLAAKHFKSGEVLSSDTFRQLVADDPVDQECTADAFECLYHVAAKRTDRRKLVVIDSTNLKKAARRQALDFAKQNNCFVVAIILDVLEKTCLERNAARTGRRVADYVIARQYNDFRQTIKNIKKEGFRWTYILTPDDLDSLEIVRNPLWTDRSSSHGPFDIIGDVHGCNNELCRLLEKMGYEVNMAAYEAQPPEGRTAIFLGDLCDRGPMSVAVLRMVMNMACKNRAICIPGNHEDKLLRYLQGKDVVISHGLESTVAELKKEDEIFKKELAAFLRAQISHYLLDDGKLVVAHAGLPEKMQGRSSAAVREFCLYGLVTGEKDVNGLPVRLDWARDYHGKALVVYGHNPVGAIEFVNNTICLDGGCVFGGSLNALRYPEKEIVSLRAEQEYTPPLRPFACSPDTRSLNIADYLGRRRIETRLGPKVVIEAEYGVAALEDMGRYAVDPRWLIYLPPTMSPCEAARLPDYLEYPTEAFTYYKKRGATKIICEEKHMGSRAIVIVVKDRKAAKERFGAAEDGIIYSRMGRPFFPGAQRRLGKELIAQLRESLAAASFWEDYATDWACLDCEILPWSHKAQNLITSQYASYGQAGSVGLAESLSALDRYMANAQASGVRIPETEKENLLNLRTRLENSSANLKHYNKVWSSFCWPVEALKDIRIAPFHILATEKKVWSNVPHPDHLKKIENYFGNAACFQSTRNLELDLNEAGAENAGIDFWQNLQASGAEGMVVKPFDFVCRNERGLLQPALKCRGREYLRIIYGASYTDKIDSFKKRSLLVKRDKAMREFALGLEGLERFAANESLRRVHECVFGALALESEPVDARL